MSARVHDDDGANAVEFALLLPVLIVLLFGIMYGSSLYNTQQTVTQAARESARFGATHPGASDVAWAADINARARSVIDTDSPLSAGPAEVCVRFYDDGGVAQTPHRFPAGAFCPPVSTGAAQGARVEVTVRRPATLEVGIGSFDTTVSRTGVARYEAG